MTDLTTNRILKATQIMAALAECLDTISSTDKRHRKTTDELSRDSTDTDKSPESFERMQNVPLSSAVNIASHTPGVYILYLDGRIMKCGQAAYGLAARLRQYYNLNYDNAARAGSYLSVTKRNRGRVTVSWQCCPISKCNELEYKLFQKYGKGPWAKRAPASCTTDSWKLLI